MDALDVTKKQIRDEAIRRRDRLTEKERTAKSSAIFHRLVQLPALISAKVIMVYAAMRSEVDTSALIQWAWDHSKTVGFPVAVPSMRELVVVPVTAFEQLRPGTFGVLEPDPAAGVLRPQEIDVVIVPGVAFDPRGYRIGYGAGYYDRFLPKVKGLAVGIAFSEQIYPMIPAAVHDVPVDLIVTDQQVLYCRRQSDLA